MKITIDEEKLRDVIESYFTDWAIDYLEATSNFKSKDFKLERCGGSLADLLTEIIDPMMETIKRVGEIIE